jgi:predicted transcriptional regulator
MPVGRIIGEFTIGAIINKAPNEVWLETKEFSGITHDFFEEYFDGREEAFAIQIKEFYQYKKPINPYEKIDNFLSVY